MLESEDEIRELQALIDRTFAEANPHLAAIVKPGSLITVGQQLDAALETYRPARQALTEAMKAWAYTVDELAGRPPEEPSGQTAESPGEELALAEAFGAPGYGIAARTRALAAALAPSLARRYLERLEQTTGRSRLALQTRGP